MANPNDTEDFLSQFLPVSMGGLIPDDAPVETFEDEPVRTSQEFDSEGARAAELAAMGNKGLARHVAKNLPRRHWRRTIFVEG